ncbi:MAG: DUF6440 family protein [Acutalibacteraceae bacterium]
MKAYNRFELIEKEGMQLADPGLIMVITDKKTGVNYLFVKSGYGGGLTPLLDADGKPVISK